MKQKERQGCKLIRLSVTHHSSRSSAQIQKYDSLRPRCWLADRVGCRGRQRMPSPAPCLEFGTDRTQEVWLQTTVTDWCVRTLRLKNAASIYYYYYYYYYCLTNIIRVSLSRLKITSGTLFKVNSFWIVSSKNTLISITFGQFNPEELQYKWLWIFPLHPKIVAALPCEAELIFT